MRNVILASVALVLVGCGQDTAQDSQSPGAQAPSEPPAAETGQPAERSAQVDLQPTEGSSVTGTLAITTIGNAVSITGSVKGLTPNAEHGFHIHENGDCSAPDASSAGGHFNPAGNPHGHPGENSHLGDMLNLQADAQGIATAAARIEGATLHTGEPTDLVGRAIVVHEKADDYTSQPAGDSGKRIACGVIQ
ncbi:MAG: superoxide dismutase [Proteobacteria bacterium]|nr:MAG: superoxide dismutase [Pseudomonadota bacterium]